MLIDKNTIKHVCTSFAISLYSTEAAITVGLTKEYIDAHTKGNHWCWYDMGANLLGIALGTLIRVLVIGRWNWF